MEDLDKFIGQVGDIAEKSVGIYGDILGASEDAQKARQQPPPPQPTYQPNITAGDFAFTPNFYLIGVGVLLLLIVLVVRK
jgi:hypothetical protein